MDFTTFNDQVSLYVLMFNDFNVCTEDLVKEGIIPMGAHPTNGGPSSYTLVIYNYFK